MINKETIKNILADYLKEKKLFLVDIKINANNEIEVTIDSADQAIKLENCIDTSRFIESKLDRTVEDFSLTVGSAGLTSPFKVFEQYKKNEGKEVEITFKNGSRIKAILTKTEPDNITISYTKLEKVDDKKKKIRKEIVETYNFSEIKCAKPIICFK